MAGGVITKLRRHVGIVIIAIGISMVAFILMDMLQSGYWFFNPPIVGEVAGETIEFQEFQAMVQQRIAMQERLKKKPLEEQEREQIIQEVWQDWVNQTMFKAHVKDYGFDVPSNEMQEMYLGAEPDPTVVQFFSLPGKPYDRQYVAQVLQTIKANPEQYPDAAIQIRLLDDYLYKKRFQEKLFNLLKGAIHVPKQHAKLFYQRENTQRSFQYLAINYASIADTLVQITDEDYEEYYKENREKFRQEELGVVIQYVRFDKTPTAKDSAKVKKELLLLKEEFQKTDEDSFFVMIHSDDRQNAYIKAPYESLLPRLKSLVDTLQPDTIIGPILNQDKYELIKYRGYVDEPAFKLKHVLIQPQGNTAQDTANAKALADSLLQVANDTNFNEIAVQYSVDQQTRYMGGDLGWYTQNRFGPKFLSELKKQNPKKGDKILIQSDVGFHIVQVVDRVEKQVVIAIIAKKIYPSSETIQQLSLKAMEFHGLVSKNPDKFVDIASEKGYAVRTSKEIKPSDRFLPGFSNPKRLTQWALNTEEEGAVSEVIDEEEALVVAQIHLRLEPGYKPLRVVKEQIKPEVLKRKKAAYIIEQLKKIKANSLEEYRQQYKGSAYIASANNVTIASYSIRGIGSDPILQGAVFRAPLNKLYGPIAGKNNVFIIKVTEEIPAKEPDEKTLEDQRRRLEQTKRNLLEGKLYNAMREAAKIRDYRYKFGY